MAISKRLRFEILRRDNHQCRYCGAKAPETPLTVDHVVPSTLGGSDDASNLVAACKDCNSGKSSVPADAAIVADVSADAIRWARAMEQVALIREREALDRLEINSWFNAIWCYWSYGPDNKEIPAPEGWTDTVVRFLAAGLTRREIEEFVSVAMRASHVPPADTWRYFCGCCWKRIRENAEMAAAIIAADPGVADG